MIDRKQSMEPSRRILKELTDRLAKNPERDY
jgi:hypothetical protein